MLHSPPGQHLERELDHRLHPQDVHQLLHAVQRRHTVRLRRRELLGLPGRKQPELYPHVRRLQHDIRFGHRFRSTLVPRLPCYLGPGVHNYQSDAHGVGIDTGDWGRHGHRFDYEYIIYEYFSALLPRRADREFVPGVLALLLRLQKLRQHGEFRGRVPNSIHRRVTAAVAHVQSRRLCGLVPVRECPGPEQLRGLDVPQWADESGW